MWEPPQKKKRERKKRKKKVVLLIAHSETAAAPCVKSLVKAGILYKVTLAGLRLLMPLFAISKRGKKNALH